MKTLQLSPKQIDSLIGGSANILSENDPKDPNKKPETEPNIQPEIEPSKEDDDDDDDDVPYEDPEIGDDPDTERIKQPLF